MVKGQGRFGVLDAEKFERWKPADKQDWMTVTELARLVERDPTWIRKLDREGKLPKAARFKVGRLSIRLYTPAQQVEIQQLFKDAAWGSWVGKRR
jgi:hypothetical protein